MDMNDKQNCPRNIKKNTNVIVIHFSIHITFNVTYNKWWTAS